MKNKTLLYVAGAIALFYILKKKGMLGDIAQEAQALTAEEVNNLNFAIDYDSYEAAYRRQQERPEIENTQNDAKVCN